MVERFEFKVEDEGDVGERLDAWLAGQTDGISRTRISQLIRTGRVSVNRVSIKKASLPVRLGDAIRLGVPPPEPLELIPEDIPLDVIYEDSHLLVINKQPNLVVHPTGGHRKGTLVHALLHHCDDLSGISGVERPGIVHRLDKDTSGIILVAKTDLAHLGLQAQFAARTVTKAYRTLVHGHPLPHAGTIKTTIGRSVRDRKRMAVGTPETRGGKHAVSHYEIERRFAEASLVRVRIATGRTHQIRVHMQHLGHCVLGDMVYYTKASKAFHAPRQMLHAAHLEFRHPETLENMVFDADLPMDMVAMIERLVNP